MTISFPFTHVPTQIMIHMSVGYGSKCARNVVSLSWDDGNKHAQIFANESFFATAYPMEHKSSAGQAQKQFISDFGIPDKLVCNGAAEQVGKRTEFQSTV